MGNDRTIGDGNWLTIEEAAAVANVSRQTVYTWIRRGVPDGHGTWIDAEELARLRTAQRAAAAGQRIAPTSCGLFRLTRCG